MYKFLMVMFLGLVLCSAPVYASHDHGGSRKTSSSRRRERAQRKRRLEKIRKNEVGNKICPISGLDLEYEDHIVGHEYKGKIYNLCCEEGIAEFDKDPEKYKKIVEEQMGAHMEEHMGETKGSHKGSHSK